MSKFISEELKQVDCGDGEWVKIPTELSIEDVHLFLDKNTNENSAVRLLKSFIREWNFKDNNGQLAELSELNIKKLKLHVINLIKDEIYKLINVDDKKKE